MDLRKSTTPYLAMYALLVHEHVEFSSDAWALRTISSSYILRRPKEKS